jgi:hypothetical protein
VSRSRLRERGAVAVEAALVTPLVFALIFGIMESAFLMKNVLAASSSVRAGVRLASAQPRDADFAQTTADEVAARAGGLDKGAIQALWVYKAAVGSDKPYGRTDFGDCAPCVKFSWNSDAGKFVVAPGSPGWAADQHNACAGLAGPPDRIGVYLLLKHTPLTGLVLGTLSIPESSVLSLEPIPSATGCKP